MAALFLLAITSHLKPSPPERTFSESAPFAINFVALALLPVLPGNNRHHKSATAAPIKRDTGSQYDAIPQKQLNVDSTSVNNNSRDYTVKPYSMSTAPYPPSPECLVSAHNDVRGVVVQVHERSAIVGVEQDGLTNYTEVQAFSFYKDGTLVEGDLRHVLRVGDEITMDFMLCSTGYDLMTHCNMAWQGVKPQSVDKPRFKIIRDGITSNHNVPVAFNQHFLTSREGPL
ncbi:hypothetical protein MTO96_044709 [Rhipicephalus appendiculatus]